MRKSTKIMLRSRLYSTSALACAAATLLVAPNAVSQEDESEARQETVVVTGSRIPTDPNLVSSVPVQSVDSDDIKLSGEINLADVVNDIPALVSSVTSSDRANEGANFLNLRGLGADRTLTLVNGRRHVAGFRGSSAVEVSSIPRALVERVEVTTGGASAVYGADAVTGVVNFILKDDFEGLQLDVQGGLSGRGDAESLAIDGLYGLNFDNDRGNLVLGLSYEKQGGITHGDRPWSRNNGIATTQTNPASLTDPNAPAQAIIEDPSLWLTSQEGSIAPTFFGRDTVYVDINNNGIADCQESEGGRAGFLAGCWLTNPDGSVRVNQDGIVLNGLWSIGGDGGRLSFDRDTLLADTESFVANLNSNYQFSDTVSGFLEAKYVLSETELFFEQDTFYDTLFVRADNPFIPSELQPVVAVTGGLLLTQDPLDFSDNNPETFERETYRFVGGLEWEFADGHTAEFSANHGKFKRTSNETGLYLDRVFAALDAVVDPASGETVCRSDLDPNAFYEIDFFTAISGYANGGFASNRYYSFTPGDGQCAPLNPFGTYSASRAAQEFVTSHTTDVLEVEQTVIAATAVGELEFGQSFLAGPIGYAAGVEWRDESSDNQLDPLTLGILPAGTSFTPGAQVSTVDPFLFSFTSIDNTQQFNSGGGYDVLDTFLEVRVPVLRDQSFAKELSFDAAVRRADYSTLGETTTWKVGGTWAPSADLSFRATVSEAVRAPNIAELFDPRLPIQIGALQDPCDPTNVDEGSAAREANCIAGLQAAGVGLGDIVDGAGNYIWINPLTARFSGVSGGNPNLDVETAETTTIGAVFTPSFVDGLSITLDYWDVTIEDAISAVAAGDILDGCHDSNNFPSLEFCSLFTRRADGGLNFLESGQINFAQLEASGIDFAINYAFDVGENTFGARLVGSRQEKLDRFFNPTDPTDVDPELEEVARPKLSGNLVLSWDRGPLSVSFQTNYQSEQFAGEIEDFDLFGNAGFFGETYIYDINASMEFSERLSGYIGMNNITDEEPFATQRAFPADPRGRYGFIGLSYKH